MRGHIASAARAVSAALLLIVLCVAPVGAAAQASGPSGANAGQAPAGQPVGVVMALTNENGVWAVRADFHLAPGYHQFADSGVLGLRVVEPSGLRLGPLQLPAATRTVNGLAAYEGDFSVGAVLSAGQGAALPAAATLEASWQVCRDDGICLRPESRQFVVALAGGTGDASSGVADAGLADAGGAGTGAVGAGTGSGEGVGGLFWIALGLALVGGLLLNVMPCVLPVLSLKLVAMAKQGGLDRRLRVKHALLTGLGVELSLLALGLAVVALQAGGRRLGWGFQFQDPRFALTLGFVVLAFALSMLGAWRIPEPRRRSGVRLNGGEPSAVESLGSGSMLVLMATPCTAPFLGSAVGFAFGAPAWQLLAVFAVLGIGLTAPYLAFAFFDKVRLPKPGPWMDRLTVAMGFALLGSFLWLVGASWRQVAPAALQAYLWAALGLAAALRVWGWIQDGAWNAWPRRAAGAATAVAAAALLAAAVGAAAPAVSTAGSPAPAAAGATSAVLPAPWRPFDPAAIAADQAAGRPVFVDFTADWCLTCKINEAGPLADPAVLRAFEPSGLRWYRGDYTNPSPLIDEWLARYRRAGVPFYLLLGPKGQATVLPELLDGGTLAALAAGLPPFKP